MDGAIASAGIASPVAAECLALPAPCTLEFKFAPPGAAIKTSEPFNNTPIELRQLRQWLVWKYDTTEGGKPKKVPYCAATDRYADVNNPDTWTVFEAAISAYSSGQYDGIGFVFTAADPYVGIDFDHCLLGSMTEQQARYYEALKPFGYSEISPSGNGVHIIVKGRIPHAKRQNGIEIYDRSRFFTMTGNVI